MATDRSIKTKARAHAAKEFVMLAKTYKPSRDVVHPNGKRQRDIHNWWIYQKIDGVRCRLTTGSLWTRSKKRLVVPQTFLKAVESVADGLELDGELVHKNGSFRDTIKTVRNQRADEQEWKHIRYMVFDIVDSKMSYRARDRQLKKLEAPTNGVVRILRRTSVIKKDTDVTDALTKAITKGQEGLILRNPEGKYKFGRSWDLLKVKEFMDLEATVLEHYGGEGRNEGVLGGVVCKMDNGKTFKCGTGFTDEERQNPPKIGETITVRFFELTDAGVPRFPHFICIRDYE